MKAILTALCAVQADLAQEGIAKKDTNTFDNYKFRGIDAVLNALAPILSRHGVIIMPSVTSSEIRQVTSSQGKPQQHAKVTVDYTLYCHQGEGITHSFVGEGMDRGDKAINKACTAAYKYFLFEAFCIPVEGTPDADSESPEVGDVETPEMVEAGVQLNDCLEQDDYHGAAQIYAEWSHEENVIIARAPSKGGELSTANRVKLKSPEFRHAFNEVRGINTESAA